MEIRAIKAEDAGAMIVLTERLTEETTFMLFEPGERKVTEQQQTRMIQSLIDDPDSCQFVVEEKGELLGFVVGRGGAADWGSHSVYCVIGIRQVATGRGLGKALMQKIITWASGKDFIRMELTVMCHNQRAIKLYQSCGFEIEGTKTHSLKVNGVFVDEYLMARKLN
ncbi:GNAT family N-acetyltransferase [Veronia pacifica]|uniref:GCN5 family acetyltransferase n=1 Tax=Veronia pacifica TaxID=1080227 RepID=A0A1C3EPQ4_9GAMM|nr:GNAT family N-acetyltransferase [Veronia pacifica]ODA35230.1 GCN5 family acetyltransferase [Veronia pacifica]